MAATLLASAAVPSAQSLPSEIRWSVAVSAPPSGPPVIANGVVVAPLQSALVVAHAVTDGSAVWQIEASTDQPLATDGARVFVASGEAVRALDAATGTPAWLAPTGTATAPLLAQGGWVIVPTEGKLSALRAADGSVVWTRETGPQRERASFEGDRLYVPLTDGRVLALELKTGNVLWQRTLRGAPTEILPLEDRLYVGSADKRLYALRAADGDVDWNYEVRAPLRGRPALAEDRIIIVADNNELRAFDRGHGALRWRQGLPFRPTGGPVVIGSAVLAPGTVAQLRAYDTASRGDAGALEFGQPLATSFAVGEFQGSTVLAAFTGTLTEQWKLVLLQAPSPPSLSVETDLGAGNWKAGFESLIVR